MLRMKSKTLLLGQTWADRIVKIITRSNLSYYNLYFPRCFVGLGYGGPWSWGFNIGEEDKNMANYGGGVFNIETRGSQGKIDEEVILEWIWAHVFSKNNNFLFITFRNIH